MYVIKTYEKEYLEENLDIAKVLVIHSLVKEGFLDKDEANRWCLDHKIILNKKNIFRDLFNKFTSSEESDTYYMIVVKKSVED